MRRKRKRKLKKGFKIFLISILVIAVIVLIIVFGFQIKTVKVSLDLNQFTETEVKAYMDAKKIDNTFVFWLRNKLGLSEKIELFEQYSVKMNSPVKVTITAYEKKFKGYINNDGIYVYFDDTGRILKKSTEKIKSIPKITGIDYNKLDLYEIINAKNKKALDTLLNVTSAIEEYDYNVKKIHISQNLETTLFIKKLQIQLGKENNLDRKLTAFNDMYSNVINMEGVLNMKRLSSDGSYTLKTEEETSKNENQNKNKKE